MTAFSSALVASFLALSNVPVEGAFTLRWPPTGNGSRPPFTQPFFNKLSLGHWGGCVVNDTNSLVCWGFIDKITTVDTPVNITSYVPSSTASLRVTNVGVGGYGLCYLSTNPSACTCLNTGHFPFSCPAAWASSAVSLAHGQDPWVCSLNSAGAISCVGGPYSTPPISPPGGSGWSALSSGWYHGCGVSSVGAVSCWGGSYTSGEQNVPPGLGVNVSTISTRDPYTCALLQNQTVRCWGGTWCPSQPTIPPQVANGAFKTVAISAGGGAPLTGGNMCRGCALNSTGYLVCWGSNAIATVVPSYLQGDVVAIDSGGTFFNCVVRASTAGVECWLLNTPTTPFTPSTAAMAIAVPQGGRVGALCNSIAAVVTSWDVPAVCIPPTPSPTGTPSATRSASGTPTGSATPSFTATGTPTPSITPSLSSSPSSSSSSGSSASTTPTITPSATSTPSITPSASPTPTPTTPFSPSPAVTLTPTPSSTLSFGLSPSATPTSSSTTTISTSGTPGGNLPPSTVTSTPTQSASPSPSSSAPSNIPNANNANSNASTTPLVPGAIAGITIAGVAVLGGIGAGLACCLLQGRRGKGKLPVAASVAAGGGGVQAAQQQHVVSNPLGGSTAPAATTTQPPLPHGWVEMSDETGDVWYEGPGGESVWERPTVL